MGVLKFAGRVIIIIIITLSLRDGNTIVIVVVHAKSGGGDSQTKESQRIIIIISLNSMKMMTEQTAVLQMKTYCKDTWQRWPYTAQIHKVPPNIHQHLSVLNDHLILVLGITYKVIIGELMKA